MHKLTMTLTDDSPHFGKNEVSFSTTHAENFSEMIDAFNAFLKACGYCNEVDAKDEVED